jgi:hypothetical protein
MPIGAARLGYWFDPAAVPDPNDCAVQYPNVGFELGLNGWTVVDRQINWSGNSRLAGFPTPVLPSPNLYGSTGPTPVVSRQPVYQYALETTDKPPLGGAQSLLLQQAEEGIIAAGGSLWGPAVYSNFCIVFNAGDTMAFDWRALSDTDAYTIYSYMIEKNTGGIVPILRTASPNFTFDSEWTTQYTVVPISGSYKFVFVMGSWDSTFGNYVAGRMLIDNMRRIPA